MKSKKNENCWIRIIKWNKRALKRNIKSLKRNIKSLKRRSFIKIIDRFIINLRYSLKGAKFLKNRLEKSKLRSWGAGGIIKILQSIIRIISGDRISSLNYFWESKLKFWKSRIGKLQNSKYRWKQYLKVRFRKFEEWRIVKSIQKLIFFKKLGS